MVTNLLVLLHIAVCFILIAVILLQAGKGQGLAGAAFGGGNVDSLLGTKGADFMTKVTTVAAISFMVTCLTLSMIETHRSRSLLQTGQNTAPIDVDQIKKALEKVKSEAAKETKNLADVANKELEDAKASALEAKVEIEEDASKAITEAKSEMATQTV